MEYYRTKQMTNGAEVMADISNYTNAKPVIQISEVRK